MPDTSPATPPGAPGPGRPGLSFEAYEQAYVELTGTDGAPPSQRQLRKYLGTGNNNTLAKYRRRIAEERIADEKPAEPGSLDAALLATVQTLATQIALDEAQVAEDRVEEIRKEAEQRIHVAEATMEKRLKDTALLEYRATTAEAALQTKDKVILEKDKALDTLIEQHHALNTEHVANKQALDEMRRQVATLTRERNALADKVEGVIEEEKRARTQFQEEIKTLNQQLAKEHSALSKLLEKNAALSTQLDERNSVIETLNSQHVVLQRQLGKMTESGEALQIQINALGEENSTLKEQLSSVKATLKAGNVAHQTIQADHSLQLKEKNLSIKELRSAIAALTKVVETSKLAKPKR